MLFYTHVILWLFVPCIAFLSNRELQSTCKNDSNIDYSQGIVALVLARGGSKGIPLKNLAKIDNISMLGRALRIIKNCNCFVDVWVSTDSNTIAQEAYRNNVNVHYRSEYSARDEATSVESIQEFLSGHPNIKNIALIQCTSVFLNEYYLDAAVKRFVSSAHIDCVFSAYRSWKLRWKQEMHSTHLEPINFHPKSRPRRQDWQGELVETGMFYFFRRNLIQTFGLLQSDGCDFIEIDERHSLEVDNSMHLTLANILITLPEW